MVSSCMCVVVLLAALAIVASQAKVPRFLQPPSPGDPVRSQSKASAGFASTTYWSTLSCMPGSVVGRETHFWQNCSSSTATCTGAGQGHDCISQPLQQDAMPVVITIYDSDATCSVAHNVTYQVAAQPNKCAFLPHGGQLYSVKLQCQPGGFVATMYADSTCTSPFQTEGYNQGLNVCTPYGPNQFIYASCSAA